MNINAAGFAKDAGVDPNDLRKAIDSAVAQALKLIDKKLEGRASALQALQRDGGRLIANVQKLLADFEEEVADRDRCEAPWEPFAVAPAASRAAHPRHQTAPRPRTAGNGVGEQLPKAQQKLLDKLAWLEGQRPSSSAKRNARARRRLQPDLRRLLQQPGRAALRRLHRVSDARRGRLH